MIFLRAERMKGKNIVMDLLKALLSNGSINTQQTNRNNNRRKHLNNRGSCVFCVFDAMAI
jgi:hypothetical protein